MTTTGNRERRLSAKSDEFVMTPDDARRSDLMESFFTNFFERNVRDVRSFVIRFDFESYVRFEIQFVLIVRFEIFESSVLSIVIRKETIGGG